MRNILKKTAIATALSLAVVSSASAAVLDFTAAPDGTVVLANVIFGEGNPGVGSEETLITAPSATFTLTDALLVNNGDNGTLASVATVKYTLGKAAIFGEDLSTTALLNAANGGAGVFSLSALGVGGVTWQVVQGGAIGDNTITLELTFVTDGNELTDLTFDGYKVKNLTGALKASSGDPTVALGIEYVESIDNGADDITSTATDTPLTIFASQEPLTLSGTATNFGLANFVRINVGTGESTFTGGTADGRSDFLAAGDSTFTTLGTLQLTLNAITAANILLGADAGQVKKENGNNFDFQGGDTHALSFTATSGSFQVGANIHLSNLACTATAPVAIVGLNNYTGVVAADGSVAMNISGTTTALTASYNVCYTVAATLATMQIPEVDGIAATWNVIFFNSRYDNRVLSYSPYGPLTRNGCIASFFNVPASNNPADTAFVRLTNTSTTNSGDIRGTMYKQDGTVIGTADTLVAGTLGTSATQVFSSLATDIVIAGQRDILSLETAFAVAPADFGSTGSRARLILKGAFDTCEGMGLIRTGGGSLFNMTSTTMGNEAAAPNDGNNGN